MLFGFFTSYQNGRILVNNGRIKVNLAVLTRLLAVLCLKMAVLLQNWPYLYVKRQTKIQGI